MKWLLLCMLATISIAVTRHFTDANRKDVLWPMVSGFLLHRGDKVMLGSFIEGRLESRAWEWNWKWV